MTCKPSLLDSNRLVVVALNGNGVIVDPIISPVSDQPSLSLSIKIRAEAIFDVGTKTVLNCRSGNFNFESNWSKLVDDSKLLEANYSALNIAARGWVSKDSDSLFRYREEMFQEAQVVAQHLGWPEVKVV